MGTKYTECPNCGNKPSGWGGNHFTVYKCKHCGRCYCYDSKCGGTSLVCPNCSSDDRREVGEVRV